MSNHNDDLSADPLEPERIAPSSEGLQEHVIAPGKMLDARDIYAQSVVVGTQVNNIIYQGSPLPPVEHKPIFMAAPLPPDFVARPREFGQLKQQLLQGQGTGITAITSALLGAGGYGKTTLALALCHDPEIRATFPDAILWVTLGEQPSSPIRIIGELIHVVTGKRENFATIEGAAMALRETLAPHSLLVIDDVWSSADLSPLLQGASQCTCLVTTRNSQILPFHEREKAISVDAMHPVEAVQLLCAGIEVNERQILEKVLLKALTAQLGEWPLLLTLANGMLRERVIRLNDTLLSALSYLQRALEKRGVLAFDAKNTSKREEAVAQTLEVSLLQLDTAERKRYEELAIFPEDVDVPLETVFQLWRTTGNFDELDTEEFCQRLYGLSLLLSYDLKNRQIRLHDVIRNYLQVKTASRLPTLHQQFLDSYTLTHWAALPPEEPYLWEHLAEHLLAAHRQEALHITLTDVSYLEAQIRRAGVAAILADLAILPDDAIVRDIAIAVRSGSYILGQAPGEAWNQIQGRMGIGASLHSSLPRNVPRFDLRFASLLPADEALVRVFEGHTSEVNSCVFSPNGHQVLSASGGSYGKDYTLRLWDVASGTTLRIFEGHTGRVTSCAFSSDGSKALSASSDQTLRMWDVTSGATLRIFEGVTSGAFSPDWSQVISTTADNRLRLWDVASEKTLRIFEGHTDVVTSCAFSPDGKLALSASHDGTLRLWDVTSGATLRVFKGHNKYVLSCVFSPYGNLILSASFDRTLRLWDVASGVTLRVFEGHTYSVTSCAFSPDGKLALSASEDKTLRLWDVVSRENVRVSKGHMNGVNSCAFSPDGKLALTASDDSTLRLWDVASGENVHVFEGHTSEVNSCVFSPDGNQALSASGDYILGDNTLRLWDVASGMILHIFKGHGYHREVHGCAFSPDGKLALSASDDGTLRLWNVASGAILRVFKGHTRPVYGCAFSPDGKLALSASADTTLRLWDVTSGAKLRVFKGHTEVVWSCSFSPDGKLALSSSGDFEIMGRDKTMRLWDVASGATLRVFDGFRDRVKNCAFSPDGRQIMSASYDGTLRLWDVASGVELAYWLTDARLFCCAFHPNGGMVIAGDSVRGVHFLSLVDR